MISVLIKRNEKGVLCGVEAAGHAGYAEKGSDIVCSSVTVLLRTVMKTAESLDGVELKADTGKRGYLSFRVNAVELGSELERRLIYAGDFLETGLKSVAEEYPEYVKLMKKTV